MNFMTQIENSDTPLHVKQNAVFEDVGQWKRPGILKFEKESMHEAVQSESNRSEIQQEFWMAVL